MDHPPIARLVARGRRRLFWPLVALGAVAVWMVAFRVDFTPQVGGDFFFSTDDPAFQASKRIEELFPGDRQVLVAVRSPETGSASYLRRLGGLTDALSRVAGVTDVKSLTRGPKSPEDARESPLWRRLLLSEDPKVTSIIVSIDRRARDGGGATVRQIERVMDAFTTPGFEPDASGVPWVAEHIKQRLERDLEVFSIAAVVAFGIVILVVYRSWPLVVGTLATCVAACCLTLAALHLAGTPIGLLTANITTIVFVLTLSHTVFLSANWRRVRVGRDRDQAAAEAVRVTFGASFWCMVAALLGFSSLLLATAKPLRELGVSGLVGTLTAIVAAYGLYPRFLRFERAEAAPPPDRQGRERARLPGAFGPAVVGLLCLAALPGIFRLETDPSLLSYFSRHGGIRHGLAVIDASGGSSPLELVVQRSGSAALDTDDGLAALGAAQSALERDPAVGRCLSLAVLVDEAERRPLAKLLSTHHLVEILRSPKHERVACGFVTPDGRLARFVLRMRESGRDQPRSEIVDRLVTEVEQAGLEVRLAGGLYDLEGKLGKLVEASLWHELGGLLLFFAFVAAAVARAWRPALAMVACLAAVVVLLLGATGWIGRPADVISAPGANVAIALGIDGMIHLVMAVRRRRAAGDDLATAWVRARLQMRPAIVGAMSILAAGFGIFVLSSFPPTRRFGTLVAAGALVSSFMALDVLPFLAMVGRHGGRGGD